MDLEWNYEINRTANFIHTRNFTRVALQFPDELLKDSTKVVKALRDKLREIKEGEKGEDEGNSERKEVGLYVMADTTYGSCCVDEVGASHIYADCVIHYGHTCLSPTSNLPAFLVFGKASIDTSKCASEICTFAATSRKPALVLFGLEYAHAMDSIKEAMESEALNLSTSASKLEILCADVLSATLDPLKNQAVSNGNVEPGDSPRTGEICNSEVGTRYSAGGLVWSLPPGHRVEDYLVFWIGADNAAFASIVLTFNGCDIARYNATQNCLVTDVSQQSRVLRRRYYLVEKAKDANIVGILVGTLGVAGYLHMIRQMKELIIRAGKKPYTLVMGRPNPAKLANFPECDVFVYVSCAQTALLDSKEFLAPVITPFEALLAFNRGSQWTGAYTMEFRDIMNSPAFKTEGPTDGPRFSFFKGGYVEDHEETGDENTEESLGLAVATEKALQVNDKNPGGLVKGIAKSGAEFLAGRSYQGLDAYDESVAEPFIMGRTGRAAGYAHEK